MAPRLSGLFMNDVVTQHRAWELRLEELSHILIKCGITEYLDTTNGEATKTFTVMELTFWMGVTDNI